MRKHEKARVRCDECPTDYSMKSGLRDYKENKHTGVTCACDACSIIFSTNSGLYNHKKNKHCGVLFPCGSCEKKLNSKRALTHHRESVHKFEREVKETARMYKAPIKADSDSIMDDDSVDNKAERRVKCGLCAKRFGFAADLRRHLFALWCKGI